MSKTLSVFIDESGDFGEYSFHSPFYIVSLILHNQSVDIEKEIHDLDWHVLNLGYKHHAIHTGPLIRRESVYRFVKMEDRKKLFNALFHFARRIDFKYISLCVDKKQCSDRIELIQNLSKNFSLSIRENEQFFNTFDKVIVYYDNGQVELTKIITSIFTAMLDSVEFRKITTTDYVLAQVADLLCTAELLVKKETVNFTVSEKEFFGSKRMFLKNIYKYLKHKKL